MGLPSNSYVEISTPECVGIIRWSLWEVLSPEGGAFVNGISVLIKEAPESSLAPSTKRTQQRGAGCEIGREHSR